MKVKREIVILVALIGLLSAYLLQRNTDRSRYRLPEPPEIKRTDIDRIEITGTGEAITLERKGDGWIIVPQGFPVEAEAAARMLDALQTVRLSALVSEAGDYQRYELDPKQAIRVKAQAGGKEVRNLEVGKTASSFRHTFVKLDGDDRVYQAEGNFQASFKKTVADLRDKLVLAFDQADINNLTVTQQGRSLSLNRLPAPAAEAGEGGEQPQSADQDQAPPDQWQSADGRPAERAKVNELLANLSHLRCSGYLDGETKDGLQEAIYRVELKGAQDSRNYRLELFSKAEPNATAQPAISSASDQPFLVPDWKAKDIMQPLDAFLVRQGQDEAAPEQAPAATAEPAPAAGSKPAEKPAAETASNPASRP